MEEDRLNQTFDVALENKENTRNRINLTTFENNSTCHLLKLSGKKDPSNDFIQFLMKERRKSSF